jgi:hypothetical protein
LLPPLLKILHAAAQKLRLLAAATADACRWQSGLLLSCGSLPEATYQCCCHHWCTTSDVPAAEFVATDSARIKNWFRCHVAQIVGKAAAVILFSNMFHMIVHGYWYIFSGSKNARNKTHTHTYFLKKIFMFDLLNFLKLSIHVFCLAEKSQTLQNK